MNRILIIIILGAFTCFSIDGQSAGQQDLRREVTLYNPFKPSLPDVKKRSYLPDMNDTASFRPEFNYEISTKPYFPAYTISPIKAASLLPDPLDKLYKSYVNLGLGNYVTPLAEISITNERSRKGAVGFYARHFSTNGKVKLQNEERVFAGYMDNDASLYGRKFFRKNFLEGSLDFSQKVRYAYGYDTSIVNYDPPKKEIKMGYNNLGALVSFASLTLDSSSFSYDFDLEYDFFYNAKKYFQHNIGLSGLMAKTYKGFYAGSGVAFDYTSLSEQLFIDPKYIVSLSPFVKKSTPQWNFKLGLQMLLDKNMADKPEFHLYPDVKFGFSIVPSYISFFTGLEGRLERNDPEKIVGENPFLVKDGTLFTLPNTDHALIVSAGLKGNTGLDGNYLLSASYSVVNDMLFYSNYTFSDTIFTPERGNHFIPLPDDAEVLNIHGEMSGRITDKVSFLGSANWYRYTLAVNDYAWNRPDWDLHLGARYNLRDKIIAGIDINATGKRSLLASRINDSPPATSIIYTMPTHLNFNLSAEYRYTKILSFWFKLNNISFNRYYEWAYYPSQRFLGMVGFSYSL